MPQEPSLANELAVAMNLPELSSPRQEQITEPNVTKQGFVNTSSTEFDAVNPDFADQGVTEQQTAEQQTAEQQTAEQQTAEQDADGAITKFTDLAEFFPNNSVEDLYSLELVTAGDGQAVTVGQLKDLYQDRQTFEQQKAEFEKQKIQQQEEQEELERARQQVASQFQSPDEIPEELWKARGQLEAIDLYIGSIDWGKLEQDDPGKAALMLQRYQTAKQDAIGKFDKLQAEYADRQRTARNDYIVSQRRETLKRIPDWENSETLRTDQEKLNALAGNYGFDPQFVSSISDARLLHMMRDYAMLKEKLDSMNTDGKKVEKRGNPVLRPTFRDTGKSRLKNAENRAKQPGATKADKHEAVRAILQESGMI